MPWQKWLLIHALETLPGGEYRFRTVVLLVGRQNGKTTLGAILTLFEMYCRRTRRVLGTAQDLSKAEDIWEEVVEIAEEDPDLAAEIVRPINRASGRKKFQLVGGERYIVKTPNRSAGRGGSNDLVLLDELREHTNWDAWAAVNSTILARDSAQIWCMSNAGDASSIVLRHLRKTAHLELGDPDRLSEAESVSTLYADGEGELVEAPSAGTMGLFEWSSRPGAAVDDRKELAQANPAVGYCITWRALLAGLPPAQPEWVWRTENMCQWSDGSLEGPFPPGSWEAGMDADSKIPDGAPYVWAVDVEASRERSYIAVAGFREDGLPHGEIAAARAGVAWVADWLKERAPLKIAMHVRGAAASTLYESIAGIDGVEVIPVSGNDTGIAVGRLYDLVKDSLEPGKGVRHLPQPLLDIQASTAVSRMIDSGSIAWDRRKSPHGIAALDAFTMAVWLLTRQEQIPEPPKVSAYDQGARLLILD